LRASPRNGAIPPKVCSFGTLIDLRQHRRPDISPAPREQQTPEVLAALVDTDAEKWWPMMKEFGLKAE
jgi:hypothetical protein